MFTPEPKTTRYRYKTSFETRVSRIGLGSFVDINIFVMKYNYFYLLYVLHFFKSLKSKSIQMLTPKRKLDGFVQIF